MRVDVVTLLSIEIYNTKINTFLLFSKKKEENVFSQTHI